MQRAFIRAGLELEYSKGFNPHPYVSVAIPLSVGMQSVCELMDVGLKYQIETSNLAEKITQYLPDGFEISQAYYPERKFNELKWLEISGILYYDSVVPNIKKRLKERFAMEHIEVLKKTKRGESIVDIAPHIRDMEFNGTDEVVVTARVSAQEPTIKPENILDSLKGEYEMLFPHHAAFKRVETFDSDMNVFR